MAAENIGTEEYAKWREQQEAEWKNQFQELAERYVALIEHCLQEGNEKKRETLENLFFDETFLQNFGHCNIIAELKFVMYIYKEELKAEEFPAILDAAPNSISSLLELVRRIKFDLWRIEFIGDRQADEKLCEDICKFKISPVMLQTILNNFLIEKQRGLLHLVDLFIEKKMYSFAYGTLCLVQLLLPENLEIKKLLSEVEI